MLALQVGAEALKVNPDCYRIHDALSGMGGVSSQHVTTLAGVQRFGQSFPEHVARLPGVPQRFTELRDRKAPEADLWDALRAAGRFLRNRGQAAASRRYLNLCAAAPAPQPTTAQILATDLLCRQGVEPGNLAGAPK
jgi:hypothetical protein